MGNEVRVGMGVGDVSRQFMVVAIIDVKPVPPIVIFSLFSHQSVLREMGRDQRRPISYQKRKIVSKSLLHMKLWRIDVQTRTLPKRS